MTTAINTKNNRFVDIHSHILPNVDDGAIDLETSIQMIEKSIADGVSKIILTPHVQNRMQKVSREHHVKIFESLIHEVVLRNLGIELLLGAEINYKPFIKIDYSKYTLGTSNYLLIEFSTSEQTPIEEIIYDLVRLGYNPIVAHVERYPYLSIEDLYRIKDSGGLLQTNASTILGKDKYVKSNKFIKKCLKLNLIDFVASDSHDLNQKAPSLKEAYQFLEKKLPKAYLEKLFFLNAEKIFTNQKELK